MMSKLVFGFFIAATAMRTGITMGWIEPPVHFTSHAIQIEATE